ncbi:hypothetical protein [Sandarakinorhabdus oryzae]|uniref:hypothetical protein n=1 Tax=Sandarakinorhabdus oryzae TaxID=2675220 RepID=UPI0012E204FB|nr:hypothetical protein [Sandarakinorhabdus oryzae]
MVTNWASRSSVFFLMIFLFSTPVQAQDYKARLCKIVADAAAFGMQQRTRGVDEQEAVAETLKRLKLFPSIEIKVAIKWVRGAYEVPMRDPQLHARDVHIFCMEEIE